MQQAKAQAEARHQEKQWRDIRWHGYAKMIHSEVVDVNDEVAQACGISCMPTFQFYKNGSKLDEFSGASEDKIRQFVDKLK